MATHITEAAAAADLPALLARARAGEEIVIESESQPSVTIRSAYPRRSISETIARAEANAKILGYSPVMDQDFANDLEEIIRNRKPRDTSIWDEPQP